MVKNPKPKSSSLELHWFLRIFWVVRYASSRCRCTYWKMPGIFPFCLFNSFCQVIKDMTCPLSYWSCYSPPPKNLECGPGCFTCFWKNQHKFGWSFPSKGAFLLHLPGAAGHLPCTSGGTLGTTTTWRALGSHHGTLDEPKLEMLIFDRLTVTIWCLWVKFGSWKCTVYLLLYSFYTW